MQELIFCLNEEFPEIAEDLYKDDALIAIVNTSSRMIEKQIFLKFFENIGLSIMMKNMNTTLLIS